MKKPFFLQSILIVLFFLNGCTNGNNNSSATSEPLSLPEEETYYAVKEFVDGDTFWIKDGSEDGKKIRLIGIDAPKYGNYSSEEEPYGKEASQNLKNIIGTKKVRLELDMDHYDQFSRVFAYVFLKDGTFVNEKMLADGYAKILTIQPNVKYQDVLLEAQQEAKAKQKGMWKNIQ